ncbi:MAG: VOC family protein [Pseudonocardiaceae bacterium]
MARHYPAGMLDHIGIQVADPAASLAFYLRAFAPIGMREVMRFPQGEAFVVGLSGPDGIPTFWLAPATGPEGREVHLAFRAPDRAAVDVLDQPPSDLQTPEGAGTGRADHPG